MCVSMYVYVPVCKYVCLLTVTWILQKHTSAWLDYVYYEKYENNRGKDKVYIQVYVCIMYASLYVCEDRKTCSWFGR